MLVFLYVLVTGYVTFPDAYNRFNWNDSIVNTYFFFWTSFLYLPSFYFSIAFLIYWFFSKHFSIFFFGTFLIYNTELLDFLTNNANNQSSNPLLLEVNILLTNNLNKIHPFIFYVSTILLFISVLWLISLVITQRSYWVSWTYSVSSRLSRWVFFFNFVALFLGSWWAFQEGTWGGWWNWDSSEVFGLEFFLFTLYMLHTPFFYFSSIRKLLILIYGVIGFLIGYFFIQLNFDLVSHNFGVKFFFFFNNKLFFLLSLFFLFLLLFWISTFYSKLLSVNYLVNFKLFHTNNLSKNETFWYLFLLYTFWYLTILLTFYPLLGYFIYNLTSWNVFNFTISYNILNYFFLFTLSFFIWKKNRTSNILGVGLTILTWNFWFLLLTSLNFKTYVSTFHSVLVIFFLVNVYSYQFLFLYPLESFDPKHLLTTKTFYWSHDKLNVLDALFLEEIFVNHINFQEWLVSWNFFLYSNTYALNSFQLLTSPYHVINLYKLTDNPFDYFIWIENDYTLLLVLPTFLLLWMWYFNPFRLKKHN